MTRLVSALVLPALLLSASAAEAQFCIGSPTFRDAPLQATIGASFTDGARSVDGSFAGGGESIFAGAGLSVVNFTSIDVRAAGLSGFAGAEFAADSRNRVLVCPVISLGFLAGPDLGGIDVSQASLQVGGSVGVIASDSNDMLVVPFFGLALVYDRVTTDIGGIETSASDTGAAANLGVGFIFNRNVGITPVLTVPFAAGGSDAVFTLRFSFNFGG
jgi:hypothetical protein